MHVCPSRVALVAGAGSEIAIAVATRLADEGHRIALVDTAASACYRALEAVTAAGGTAEVFPGDVGLIHEAEAIVTRVQELWQAPEIVVHDVGARARRTPRPPASQDLDEELRRQLRAPYTLSSALGPRLATGWGRIVLVAGEPCKRDADIAHAAAQAGIRGLTWALAQRLAPQGVTVNAVAPGPDTDQQAAATVAFLVSQDAEFISGQMLHVRAQQVPDPE